VRLRTRQAPEISFDRIGLICLAPLSGGNGRGPLNFKQSTG